MTKPLLRCAVLLLVCGFTITAHADWYHYDPMRGPKRWTPVGLAIIDPLGLWGANDQVTGLSLNVGFGASFDVVGFELSGIGSLVKRSFVGLQLAGIINAAAKLSGVQLAGMVNLTESGRGVQIAPGNIAQQRFVGFQLALVNVSRGDFVGFQLGFLNQNHLELDTYLETIRTDRTDRASIRGLQISLANAQSNFAGGLQLGFANVTRFESRGVSIGVANLAKSMHGLQLGLLNITQELHGIQIGAINVATRNRLPFMVVANARWD